MGLSSLTPPQLYTMHISRYMPCTSTFEHVMEIRSITHPWLRIIFRIFLAPRSHTGSTKFSIRILEYNLFITAVYGYLFVKPALVFPSRGPSWGSQPGTTRYLYRKSLRNSTYHILIGKSLWFLKLTFGPEVPILGKLAWEVNYNYGTQVDHCNSSWVSGYSDQYSCIQIQSIVPHQHDSKAVDLPTKFSTFIRGGLVLNLVPLARAVDLLVHRYGARVTPC